MSFILDAFVDNFTYRSLAEDLVLLKETTWVQLDSKCYYFMYVKAVQFFKALKQPNK